MPLDIARVAAHRFVQRVEHLRETESTNSAALSLAMEGAGPTPLLVVAERQTAGRGRGTNRWWSSEGGLTFSLLLEASDLGLAAETWPLVSLVTALAVGEALSKFAPQSDVTLKWPNDVFLSGRKVSGILVEIPAVRPAKLVVGIGVNVNNSLGEAPAELRKIATALCDECEESVDVHDVLVEILNQLSDAWPRLAAGNFPLATLWRARCHLTGRTVHLVSGANRWVGVCSGIGDDGALLLRTENGVERCLAGVVERFE